MPQLQDIKEKMFYETKSILESISQINSADDLLANQKLFSEMSDRIAFLKILAENEHAFKSILNSTEVKSFEHQNLNIPDDASLVSEDDTESIIEEKVLFENELNNIDNHDANENHTFNSESDQSFVEHKLESDTQENSTLIRDEKEHDEDISLLEEKRALSEKEVHRREIVEFTAHKTTTPEFADNSTEYVDSPKVQTEKKFKLSNIKGIKAVQHLFDNDPVEDEEGKIAPEPKSLLKSNVQTDFMEAEKKKPEFRIDLNDKVAFTKILFAGNDEELQTTVAKLNSFSNLEDAKQYLSEVYYQKDWSKVDEYAQRLWNLVENKFM